MAEELRPPVEHADLAQHWCRWAEDGEEYVLTWHSGDCWSGSPMGGVTTCTDAAAEGWVYLGPAEWMPEAHGNADSSARHYVKLAKMFAEAEVTIERLRTENTALRTERDYERARFAELPPSPPYPRAHDLGMGQREPAWVTLGSDAPAPIAGMVAAALAPGPLPATHAAALPAKAMR